MFACVLVEDRSGPTLLDFDADRRTTKPGWPKDQGPLAARKEGEVPRRLDALRDLHPIHGSPG